MNDISRLKALGIAPADILLPADGVDMERWPVIACDQYTSEPDYWRRADAFVGDSPSTLRLIVPEVHLGTEKADELQQGAAETMRRYLDGGVFRNVPQSFVYVERGTPHAPRRRGLVAAFDLEQYDFTPGNAMPIRATEGTILSRLPPRIAVRRQAPVECPHVMILIDDPGRTVIEPLGNGRDALEKLYDTGLMLGGGHVEGWRVCHPEAFAGIALALEALAARGGMLFAVGDGNHSLASAKALWDEIKAGLTAGERETHPARWALAELVNLHDEALWFHPIHRVAFRVDPAGLLAGLLWEMNKRGWRASLSREAGGRQSVAYLCGEDGGYVNIAEPECPLAAGSLQAALDAVLPALEGAALDYVHGDAAAAEMGRRPGNMAFLLNAMDKADLFPAVEKLGILPRKAFSMGEADEKRFYLECRSLK